MLTTETLHTLQTDKSTSEKRQTVLTVLLLLSKNTSLSSTTLAPYQFSAHTHITNILSLKTTQNQRYITSMQFNDKMCHSTQMLELSSSGSSNVY